MKLIFIITLSFCSLLLSMAYANYNQLFELKQNIEKLIKHNQQVEHNRVNQLGSALDMFYSDNAELKSRKVQLERELTQLLADMNNIDKKYNTSNAENAEQRLKEKDVKKSFLKDKMQEFNIVERFNELVKQSSIVQYQIEISAMNLICTDYSKLQIAVLGLKIKKEEACAILKKDSDVSVVTTCNLVPDFIKEKLELGKTAPPPKEETKVWYVGKPHNQCDKFKSLQGILTYTGPVVANDPVGFSNFQAAYICQGLMQEYDEVKKDFVKQCPYKNPSVESCFSDRNIVYNKQSIAYLLEGKWSFLSEDSRPSLSTTLLLTKAASFKCNESKNFIDYTSCMETQAFPVLADLRKSKSFQDACKWAQDHKGHWGDFLLSLVKEDKACSKAIGAKEFRGKCDDTPLKSQCIKKTLKRLGRQPTNMSRLHLRSRFKASPYEGYFRKLSMHALEIGMGHRLCASGGNVDAWVSKEERLDKASECDLPTYRKLEDINSHEKLYSRARGPLTYHQKKVTRLVFDRQTAETLPTEFVGEEEAPFVDFTEDRLVLAFNHILDSMQMSSAFSKFEAEEITKYKKNNQKQIKKTAHEFMLRFAKPAYAKLTNKEKYTRSSTQFANSIAQIVSARYNIYLEEEKARQKKLAEKQHKEALERREKAEKLSKESYPAFEKSLNDSSKDFLESFLRVKAYSDMQVNEKEIGAKLKELDKVARKFHSETLKHKKKLSPLTVEGISALWDGLVLSENLEKAFGQNTKEFIFNHLLEQSGIQLNNKQHLAIVDLSKSRDSHTSSKELLFIDENERFAYDLRNKIKVPLEKVAGASHSTPYEVVKNFIENEVKKTAPEFLIDKSKTSIDLVSNENVSLPSKQSILEKLKACLTPPKSCEGSELLKLLLDYELVKKGEPIKQVVYDNLHYRIDRMGLMVRNLEKNSDYALVNSAISPLRDQYLTNYQRDKLRVLGLITGEGGNCQAQTFLLSFLLNKNENVGLQLFTDHIRPVYLEKPKKVYDMVYNKYDEEIVLPVRSSEFLIAGILKKEGLWNGSLDEFNIAEATTSGAGDYYFAQDLEGLVDSTKRSLEGLLGNNRDSTLFETQLSLQKPVFFANGAVPEEATLSFSQVPKKNDRSGSRLGEMSEADKEQARAKQGFWNNIKSFGAKIGLGAGSSTDSNGLGRSITDEDRAIHAIWKEACEKVAIDPNFYFEKKKEGLLTSKALGDFLDKKFTPFYSDESAKDPKRIKYSTNLPLFPRYEELSKTCIDNEYSIIHIRDDSLRKMCDAPPSNSNIMKIIAYINDLPEELIKKPSKVDKKYLDHLLELAQMQKENKIRLSSSLRELMYLPGQYFYICFGPLSLEYSKEAQLQFFEEFRYLDPIIEALSPEDFATYLPIVQKFGYNGVEAGYHQGKVKVKATYKYVEGKLEKELPRFLLPLFEKYKEASDKDIVTMEVSLSTSSSSSKERIGTGDSEVSVKILPPTKNTRPVKVIERFPEPNNPRPKPQESFQIKASKPNMEKNKFCNKIKDEYLSLISSHSENRMLTLMRTSCLLNSFEFQGDSKIMFRSSEEASLDAYTPSKELFDELYTIYGGNYTRNNLTYLNILATYHDLLHPFKTQEKQEEFELKYPNLVKFKQEMTEKFGTMDPIVIYQQLTQSLSQKEKIKFFSNPLVQKVETQTSTATNTRTSSQTDPGPGPP